MKLIFTGPGKGKTSAAAGVAFRSWGHGRRVLVLLFLKDARISGEWQAVKHINSPRLVVKSFGRRCPYPEGLCCPGQQECIVTSDSWGVPDEEQAACGLQEARQAIASGEWDLIVLDEVLNLKALAPRLEAVIQQLLKSAPEEVDLIMTGRGCFEELVEQADLVTYMDMVKHPYTSGITAKKGIDY